MKAHIQAYGMFLAFVLVTKVLVAPMAKNMNIPYLKDL